MESFKKEKIYLENEIKNLENEIKNLKEKIECFELNSDDYEDQYEEALNEQGPIKIGALEYDPAMVLKEVDPIAYNAGLSDYVDSLDKEDNDEYKNLEEELERLEDLKEKKEEELEEWIED